MTLKETIRLWKLAKEIAEKNCCVKEDFEIFEALLAQVMLGGSLRDMIVGIIRRDR